jgi:hypothetical protein
MIAETVDNVSVVAVCFLICNLMRQGVVIIIMKIFVLVKEKRRVKNTLKSDVA